ncbi:MAG: protein-glutamine glutaminase family protein [Bacteriovoracia bacterium]
MRFLLVLLVTIFSHTLFADTQLSTQIFDIDMGQNNEEPLIFLTSGQVVSFPKADKALISTLKKGITNRTWFLITINDRREILHLKEIPSPLSFQSEVPAKAWTVETEVYHPSVLKSLDQARSFFYEARTNAREESQCFNRAHVWSYEWRIKHNLYSSKAWIFFTRKFIRKYKFEWWFHVAPMVHVVIDNQVKERVMDIKYARGPLKLKQWTDIFMRDKANCPVVEKYTDHANHPESGSCFLMKSNMYYYQPVDLEQKEITGTEKLRWLEPEVRHAFKDAFDATL